MFGLIFLLSLDIGNRFFVTTQHYIHVDNSNDDNI